MMFWKRKEVPVPILTPPPIRTTRRNELEIHYFDGKGLSFYVDDWKSEKIVTPWVRFYKWFFGRKSEFFMLRHKDGETLITRSSIRSFVVLCKNVKVIN